MGEVWTGPLACLSLSSVMSRIRSDPSIWKPVFPNLVLQNKVAGSRDWQSCSKVPFVSFFETISKVNSFILLRWQKCVNWQIEVIIFVTNVI